MCVTAKYRGLLNTEQLANIVQSGNFDFDFDFGKEVALAEDPETDLELYEPDPHELRRTGFGTYRARRHHID